MSVIREEMGLVCVFNRCVSCVASQIRTFPWTSDVVGYLYKNQNKKHGEKKADLRMRYSSHWETIEPPCMRKYAPRIPKPKQDSKPKQALNLWSLERLKANARQNHGWSRNARSCTETAGTLDPQTRRRFGRVLSTACRQTGILQVQVKTGKSCESGALTALNGGSHWVLELGLVAHSYSYRDSFSWIY